jgi:hypothetical protein
MPRFKIAGVWEGRYWYYPLEGAALPTEPTRFQMTLQTSWLLPGFWGEVWDDSPFGRDERGRISGQRTGYNIRFVKQMPVARFRVGGESLTFKAYYEREGLPVDENPQHPPLLYVGEYLPDSDSLEGTWRFLPTPTTLISKGQALELAPGEETGRWIARRSNERPNR